LGKGVLRLRHLPWKNPAMGDETRSVSDMRLVGSTSNRQ